MTDKEKILKKIHNEMDELIDAQGNFFYAEDEAAYNALCDLGEYIESLPERIKSEDVMQVQELTALEEKAKRYAIEQVLCTTDTRMSEQSYLSLKIFNGYDVACAYKDGAENAIDKACEWLKEHLWEYDQYSCIQIDVDDLVKDFKQAMEDTDDSTEAEGEIIKTEVEVKEHLGIPSLIVPIPTGLKTGDKFNITIQKIKKHGESRN